MGVLSKCFHQDIQMTPACDPKQHFFYGRATGKGKGKKGQGQGARARGNGEGQGQGQGARSWGQEARGKRPEARGKELGASKTPFRTTFSMVSRRKHYFA